CPPKRVKSVRLGTVARIKLCSKTLGGLVHGLWCSSRKGATDSERGAGAAAGGVPKKTGSGADARALRRAPAHQRSPLRGAEARGPPPPLRPPPRDGRGLEELGGAQGTVGACRGATARRARRGSPGGVRRFRGRDRPRQLRGGCGNRVGPRLVSLDEAGGSPRAAPSGQGRGRALRLPAPRPLDARAHVPPAVGMG